jgi:hypothetical protein
VWVVFLGCLIVEISLFYLDLTVNWWHWSDSGAIRRLFNTTREDGLASWFAVSQTLVVALVAWVIFAVATRRGDATPRRAGWLVVALFFSYICLDDGAAVHERIGTAFDQRNPVDGYPSYPWQLLFLPLFTLVGGFLLGFLWVELRRPVDRAKVVLAIGCFVVAVAFDFVEGMDQGYQRLVAETGWRADTVRHFSKSIEEIVEMLGMSIFLVTFLGYLARTAPRIHVHFVDQAGG